MTARRKQGEGNRNAATGDGRVFREAKHLLHADIDASPFDIAPLLEWADRDESEGAKPPAEPEE